jgi:hypothetical protein
MTCPHCGIKVDRMRDTSGEFVLLDEREMTPVYFVADARGHVLASITKHCRAMHRCTSKTHEGRRSQGENARG